MPKIGLNLKEENNMENLKEEFDQLAKMAGILEESSTLEEAKRMPKLKGGRREHNKLTGLLFGTKAVGYRLFDIEKDVKLLGKMRYIDNNVAKQVAKQLSDIDTKIMKAINRDATERDDIPSSKGIVGS